MKAQIYKLRVIFGDALFVRAGRGIAPTSRAQIIAEDVHKILSLMRELTASPSFIPAEAELQFAIAANDPQRELLLPDLYRKVSRQVRDFNLRIIPMGLPSMDMLREGKCDFLLSPIVPDAPDIMQCHLLDDRVGCFFDSVVREAPKSLSEFTNSRHVSVTFLEQLDQKFFRYYLGEAGQLNPAVAVSNFSGIASFLRGTDMIAALPRLMGQSLMPDLAFAELPYEAPVLSYYLLWHKRHHEDPAHRWFRAEMEDVAKEISRET